MPREATQDQILHDPAPPRRVTNRRSYYTSVLESPENGSSQPVIQNHYLPKPSLYYRSVTGRIVQTQIPSRTSHAEKIDRTDSPRTASSLRSFSFPNPGGLSFPDVRPESRSRSMAGSSQRLPSLHINTNLPDDSASPLDSRPNLSTNSTMKVQPLDFTHPTFTASKPLSLRPQNLQTSICLSFPSPPLPTTLPTLKSLEKALSGHLTALTSHITTIKTLTHQRPLSKLKKTHERTSLLLLSNLIWYSHTTIRQLPPTSPLRSEWIVQISVSWERKIEFLWEGVRREVDALTELYVENKEWIRTIVGNGKEWERCRRKWCARFEESVRRLVVEYEKFWRGRIREGIRGKVWNVALDV